MLTLRFETDSRGRDHGDSTFIVCAPSFRTEKRDGRLEVEVLNSDRHIVESVLIGHDLGCFDRLFVMNADGKTVARFDPPLTAGVSIPVEGFSGVTVHRAS